MELYSTGSPNKGFAGIIGASDALYQLRRVLVKFADSAAPVLLLGESGTGKELVAHAVHDLSARHAGRFIAENCAALPETLLESEMFGYARGAFTGAVRAKPGLFEAAEGGTLFLDEIAETSLEVQAKLLRVLEAGEVRRLGDTLARPIDARVIAATSCDLLQAVEERRFRPELYYRLSVLSVQLPSLRERKEDILPLAEHFLERSARQEEKTRPDFAPEVVEALLGYDWPGNVRQLRNEVERMVVLADDGEQLGLEYLSPRLQESIGDKPLLSAYETLPEAVERFKREMIANALMKADENRTRAAKLLGISRSNLQHTMKRLKLD